MLAPPPPRVVYFYEIKRDDIILILCFKWMAPKPSKALSGSATVCFETLIGKSILILDYMHKAWKCVEKKKEKGKQKIRERKECWNETKNAWKFECLKFQVYAKIFMFMGRAHPRMPLYWKSARENTKIPIPNHHQPPPLLLLTLCRNYTKEYLRNGFLD